MAIETLHDNDWLSLKKIVAPELGINGYVYSHETRCNGQIVAVLPFRRHADLSVEYLLRREVTPCWSLEPIISALTGGVERGQAPNECAIYELVEEAGFLARPEDLIYLGQVRGTKSTDTLYSLFAVNVTGWEQDESLAVGDGTPLDAGGSTVWTQRPWDSEDPHVSAMYARLQDHY